MSNLVGETGFEVNTRIRITRIADADPDEKKFEGCTGRLTHVFPGNIWPGVKYIAGVWLDSHPMTGKMGEWMNLCAGDKFEVICDVCNDIGWILSEMYGSKYAKDGTIAVMKCDECEKFKYDEDAAKVARKAGVPCSLTYPCKIAKRDFKKADKIRLKLMDSRY